MPGRLEVICGPMFSGKTEELIRRYKRKQIARQSVLALKPSIDDRFATDVKTHSGAAIEAIQLDTKNPRLIPLSYYYNNIFIDEAQFFEEPLLEEIDLFISVGGCVTVCGLDMTFRREPFGIMPVLMAKAESVLKLSSVCHRCGEEAHFTQRLVDGKPAPFAGPTVVVGGLESYEARCRRCFKEGKGL